MTAKEMFEKLEYKCNEDDDYIEYITTWNDWFGKGVCEIAFDYNIKQIEIYCYIDRKNSLLSKKNENINVVFSIEELQAINKQVEELGWNKWK